jgi:hypothetical protein
MGEAMAVAIMTATPNPRLLAAINAAARFGPITSLFVAKEAVASVALDKEGETYFIPEGAEKPVDERKDEQS